MLYTVLGLLALGILTGIAVYRWRRFRTHPLPQQLSMVCQQHIDLLHGGQLDEAELDSTKKRFAHWLSEEQYDRIEASLVPGLSYVVRVRALAELGTDAACTILQRQIHRTITKDPLEQSWYWIDVAHCLHMLAHEESLPILLERLTEEDDFPFVHFYASEVVAFHGFSSYLVDFPDRLSEAAIRAVHRTLEGLRCDISAQIVAETRLGEIIESIWDRHHHLIHPLLVRLFSEVLRHQRRAAQYSQDLAGEQFEQEAYEMQVSRMASVEDEMISYLAKARQILPRRLDFAESRSLRDWLEALQELRADAGSSLVQLLRDNPNLPHAEQVVITLGWSKSPQAAAYLRETAARTLPAPQKPASWWSRGAQQQHPQAQVTAAALIALRQHASEETEQLLLAGARSTDAIIRSSAISSLGWWEPVRRKAVLMYLQDARYDSNGEVRYAARAALARLGERQALQWFRQGLASDNRQIVMDSIQAIADEGITLLWPELDRLVDEEEPDLASCAREALEQMQEELERN